MALSTAEQTELNTLNQRAGVQAPLTEDEQIELQGLNQRASTVPGELVGTDIPKIELRQRQEAISDEALLGSASAFLAPASIVTPKSIRNTNVFTLLESVNQARLFKDRTKRKQAFNELKRRGIPNEFIRTFTELDDPTGFLAGLKEEAPEIIGGLVGGIAGGIAGRGDPQAARRGAVIGAGVGAGAIELLREPFEREFRPERRRTTPELLTDTGFTAGTEALGELGGRLVIEPLAGRLLRPFAGTVVPGAPKVSRELAEAGRQVAEEGGASPLFGTELPIQTGGPLRRGIAGTLGLSRKVSADLTPSQQTASRTISLLEGVTEEAFFGGGKLVRSRQIAQRAASPRAIANKLDEITGGLDRLSLDEIGVLAQDSIHGSKVSGQRTRGASGAFRAMERQIFSDITQRIPDPIDISSVQKIAQNILTSAEKGGPRLKLPENTESILRKIVKTSSSKSMSDTIFTRSDVGDLVRAAGLAGEAKSKQVLAPVMKELTDIMNSAASKAGPGVAADLKACFLLVLSLNKRA